MSASQIIRSRTRSGTTAVPYPRSIALFHTCLKDPFHTSDPYVVRERERYIYIYYLNICIFIYIYICLCFEHVQSDFPCVRTCLSAHTYMSACMQEYVYYAQALPLCWQVCASCSTYSCFRLCCVMVGMYLAAPAGNLRMDCL